MMILAGGWSAMFLMLEPEGVALEFTELTVFVMLEGGRVVALDDTLMDVTKAENFVHLVEPDMGHETASMKYHSDIARVAKKLMEK